MADENAHPPESRIPLVADSVRLCRELNARRARYIIVGGFAVIQHGFLRTTGAGDLLIEDSPENQARTKQALEILPDKAVRELDEESKPERTVLAARRRNSLSLGWTWPHDSLRLRP